MIMTVMIDWLIDWLIDYLHICNDHDCHNLYLPMWNPYRDIHTHHSHDQGYLEQASYAMTKLIGEQCEEQ